MNWFYLWVPILIGLHFAACKLSIMNQAGNNAAAVWMWIIGALPIWITISRFSRNILFDAMLYDSLLTLTYAVGIAYFGDKILTPMNYVGMCLVFAGVLMVKL
jgi:multidrug transporter EmrE-like cation transporter